MIGNFRDFHVKSKSADLIFGKVRVFPSTAKLKKRTFSNGKIDKFAASRTDMNYDYL